MTAAAQILQDLSDRGVKVWPKDGLLHMKPKSRLDPGLLAEVKAHKPELISLLRDSWPIECIEAERRFRQPHARLFPLIGGQVSTPMGPGCLRQVTARAAAVALQSGALMFMPWKDVRP